MYLTVGPNILVGQQETPVSHYPIYICMLQSHITKNYKKNGKRQLFEQFKDTCTECPKILCCPRNYTGKKLHNSKEFIHTKPMMLRQTSNILSDRKLNNQIPDFQIENFKYSFWPALGPDKLLWFVGSLGPRDPQNVESDHQ